MKLTSLLSHSCQLFELIIKSSQPADNLAGYFLSSKKYIGSKERTFISETVFTILRIKLIAGHCIQSGFHAIDDGINKHYPENNSLYNFALISAGCLIANEYPSENYFFSINKIISTLYENKQNFHDEMSQALIEFLSLNKIQSLKLIESVLNSLDELNLKAKEIINSDLPLDEKQLQILETRYSMPAWILNNWLNDYKFSAAQCANLAESLLFQANVCLRVNTLAMTRDQAIAELNSYSISCKSGNLSPHSIILEKRRQLNSLQIFKSGAIEIQDEASQLTAFAMAPEPNWKVLDACAGAGGKTLHIATLQKDKGSITATDIELSRLKEIKKRAGRHGFKSITTILLQKGFMYESKNKQIEEMHRHKFDAILIDAPCSGMGTVRRMPMAKWRLNPKLLERHSTKQFELIDFFSKFLKPGGILIYSTCSLMPDENDKVIERFLNNNENFVPDSLYESFNKYNINVEGLSKTAHSITLMPSKHDCDGFFIARLKKVN